MDCPKISIVTVVLNAKDQIEKTVLSAINQTYSNTEIIIIDGGSIDGTLGILSCYAHRFTVFLSEKDSGIYHAMNKGLRYATGEYILFLNAGDFIMSDQTIENVFKMTDFNHDLIYGLTEKRFGLSKKISKPGGRHNFYRKMMVHQSVFTRTSYLKEREFNTKYKVSADFDFLYGCFHNKCKSLFVDIIISSFDMEGFSKTNRYVGFKENQLIPWRYNGRFWFKVKISLYFMFVAFRGRVIDLLRKYLPALYRKFRIVYLAK